MMHAIPQQDLGPGAAGAKLRPMPMTMCPMAAMCRGMMEKRPSNFLMMLPGSVLILAGVLLFLEPRLLVWLVGTASILMGIMAFLMANFIRRAGVRPHHM